MLARALRCRIFGLVVLVGVACCIGCDLGTYNDRMSNPVNPVDTEAEPTESGTDGQLP